MAMDFDDNGMLVTGDAPAPEPEPSVPITGSTGSTGSGEQQEESGDLDRNPNFRNYKSKVTSTINQRDNEIAQLRRRVDEQAREHEQRMRELEEANEKRIMEGLDDYGQMQYRAEAEARKRKEAEQRLYAIEQERSQSEFVGTLENRYGVPRTAIDLSHPVMAITSVADWQHKKLQEQEQEIARLTKTASARRAADEDIADMGGGTPATAISDIQRAFDRAMLDKRGNDADRLSRQAAERGLTLDRMSWSRAQRDQQNGGR